MPDPVVILGLGFTTKRLARRLRQRHIPVYAAVRNPERFEEFAALGVQIRGLAPAGLPKEAVLIDSVPPLSDPEKAAMRGLIREIMPRRILYISATGVYGAQTRVSAVTPAAPNDDKGCARIDDEDWLTGAARESTLILRCAAIYGPGRGVHIRLREGRPLRSSGGLVSRIHVDDLVTILEAGIDSPLEGAWPVADEHPATSEEVAAWCAAKVGVTAPKNADQPPIAGRSVDGSAIRELLGVELLYPGYEDGIAASLLEEDRLKAV